MDRETLFDEFHSNNIVSIVPLYSAPLVPLNSAHKGQWRGASMFTLINVWINGWVNNREAGDLRHRRGHYDIIVMSYGLLFTNRTDILS